MLAMAAAVAKEHIDRLSDSITGMSRATPHPHVDRTLSDMVLRGQLVQTLRALQETLGAGGVPLR